MTENTVYRYLTPEESLADLRGPFHQLHPQHCGRSLLVKVFDVTARITNSGRDTRAYYWVEAIQRSHKLRWRFALFAAQIVAATVQTLQIAVLRALYRHTNGSF